MLVDPAQGARGGRGYIESSAGNPVRLRCCAEVKPQGVTVHIVPISLLKSLAFALATLTATGALIAAGLNETAQAAVSVQPSHSEPAT